jgi:hypothetical protein
LKAVLIEADGAAAMFQRCTSTDGSKPNFNVMTHRVSSPILPSANIQNQLQLDILNALNF